MKNAVLIALLLSGASASTALAGDRASDEAACRSDVRRFCHQLHPDAGDNAFLSCLQAYRARLSPKCRKVLDDNGV
ncbi:hypothetical protein M2321_000144 [Rhodoblastus acidophilus]|jgi:hypothetical protein|uniref:hypothetical protein n=1 Tax=Rhodoblastus acidophilus TaxID=1074 RepID=UPI0018B017C7|nr:hypothetical protein [Rhodoblastus acidophilus]MCW2272581.1 hypothetical protein [Rhodoblastus acidophilus]